VTARGRGHVGASAVKKNAGTREAKQSRKGNGDKSGDKTAGEGKYENREVACSVGLPQKCNRYEIGGGEGRREGGK